MSAIDQGACGKIRRTRFDLLGFVRLDATTWQFVSLEEPGNTRQVGPHYRTEAELLADLSRYALESWGLS